MIAGAVALLALGLRLRDTASADAGAVVMVPAAAIGILLAAGALLLVRNRGAPLACQVGRLAAAATALLGAAVLAQYVLDWQLESPGRFPVPGHGWWARRPSPVTGLGLMMVGSSLLAFTTRRLRHCAGVCAGATLVVALTAVMGYAYGASELYGRNPTGGTALSTAIALGALAVGLIFADRTQGVAAVLLSGGPDGRLLRRLLPAALLAPPLFGWLALQAGAAGLVDVQFGTAALVVALSVMLAGYIIRQAKSLRAFEAERERLLAGERAAHEQVTNILESIADAFFAVDCRWRFTYVNNEAERLLRRPRNELIGQNLWTEFPEALGSRFRREYERALAEQRTVRFEEYYGPLDAWFDVRAFPAAEGLSVYFHDITDRRHAEEKLRESEERHRLLADMIPQHIWTTDPDGYHNYFSRRWYEFTGTTAGDTQGENWLPLLHPDDRERTLERWRHSLATGEPYAIEYRFRGKDGGYVWFLGQAMPLRNEAGQIVQWFGTLTDISERKQHEEEREQLLRKEQEARAEAERRRAELERVTESRARLMRGFSHDVKNPLSAADSQAWLLEDGRLHGELSPPQKAGIELIRRSIRNSLRLIDDLLEIARAEAGQLELECVPTDIGVTAREVSEDFRPQATAIGLSLEVRAPAGLRANTDPARLRQILANLLSNAMKYASRGTVTVDAEMRQSGGPGEGSWAAVKVIDTGPGIPPEKRELIFEEYTRLDPKAQQGAGIGLAISRRIARLMGGDLTVDSEPGRGATFTLWLPARAG